MKTTPKGILLPASRLRALRDGRMTRWSVPVTKSTSDTAAAWNRLVWSESELPPGLDGAAWPDSGGYLHVRMRPHPDDPQTDPGLWTVQRVYPRLTPGEIRYVKEAWAWDGQPLTPAHYMADGPLDIEKRHDAGILTVRRAASMPAWAARTHVRIDSVRVQRVQDISEAEARAEGMEREHPSGHGWYDPNLAFVETWNATHKSYPFESNPWAFVYGVSVVEGGN